MSFTIHRETATIIQFPSRPHLRVASHRSGSAEITFLGAALAASVPASVVDDCWYHQDAMNDLAETVETPKPC